MAISLKSSVLALKEESTEGVPVKPASATDYIALQADVAMQPSTETLTNDEVRSSIGGSKPILGLEAPTFSVSHYLRHSGVEGQAPNYRLLPKGLFGAEDVEATEYDTASSSTSLIIKVPTGEGSNFRIGQPLLIKDSTNGFRIRAIKSISGDDLTLGFGVPAAPASGVNLGKAITYYPANSAHPSISVNHYIGNGGDTQLASGCKVVSAEITAEAGQLVNVNYSLEGVGYYFNPMEVLSSANKLDFDIGAGDVTVTVPAKTYKSPEQLAETIQSLMNAATNSSNYTVSYSKSTGKFSIVASTGTLDLNWSSGPNTANTIGTLLGYVVASDDTGSLTYVADNAISFVAPHTPSYDAADPIAAKNQEVMFGSATDYACFNASSISISIGNTKVNTTSICSESGVSGSVFTAREVTVSVSAYLDQYDSSIYNKYRRGDEVAFQYTFGEKTGTNWVAGKSGCFYLRNATISDYVVGNADDLATIEMELTGFVDANGNGECFLGFV